MRNIQRNKKEKLFTRFYNHSLKVISARRYKQKRQFLLVDEGPKKQKASFLDYLYHMLGDFFIYRKIRKKLGRNFKAGVSGGGALPEYIDDFFEAAGITLIEGYGLTETSPVLCTRTFNHNVPYTVGRPLARTEIKLLNGEEREIFNGGKGVLWVCGPQVMEAYYKDPKETKKVMMKDNENRWWFNTGDLGRRTGYGDITIVGRVKDTIVLISGENIEPALIETALIESEFIEQVMICGQDQEYLTALIVPNKEILHRECETLGIPYNKEQILDLSKNEALKKGYMNIVNSIVCKAKGFKEIELIHNIAFTGPFTIENGTLTNTLKVKRRLVQKRDEKIIRKIYPQYHEGGKKIKMEIASRSRYYD